MLELLSKHDPLSKFSKNTVFLYHPIVSQHYKILALMLHSLMVLGDRHQMAQDHRHHNDPNV